MSVKDIIKSVIYEGLGEGTGLTALSIAMILCSACLVGAYLFFLYKNTIRGEFYSRDINITIAGVPVIIAAIMVAMQANLLVSLGMVGSLSIVRFRTPVKNPKDLLFLFWSVSEGIICGVGLYALAAVLCVLLTVLIFALQSIPETPADSLLILNADEDTDWDFVDKCIRSETKYCRERSHVTKDGKTEVIYEVRPGDGRGLLKALNETCNPESLCLLSYDGELRV